MMHLILERADGRISIVTTIDDSDPATVVKHWSEAVPSDWLPLHGVFHAERPLLPRSRRWRDAWRLHAGVIVVPLDAARAVRSAEVLQIRSAVIEEFATRRDVAFAQGNTARAQFYERRWLDAIAYDANRVADELDRLNDLVSVDTWIPAVFLQSDVS
jgi:hypothetical protein